MSNFLINERTGITENGDLEISLVCAWLLAVGCWLLAIGYCLCRWRARAGVGNFRKVVGEKLDIT